MTIIKILIVWLLRKKEQTNVWPLRQKEQTNKAPNLFKMWVIQATYAMIKK